MKTNQLQKNTSIVWQKTKLADIGVFSKGAGISKEELSESGHNAIRYGELYTRHNVKVNKIYSFIPDKIIPLTKKIKYGDILFAGSGETIDEIGKSATYLLKEDCYAGGDVIIFRPKNANSLFLAYFLNFGEGRKKLRELGQGQSVVHIYKSDIETLELHLPLVPEQNRIVSVLETWDKVIENLNKKIEIKKQIKKGLMQDLLTGKKRLSGFKDKWETVRLGDVAKMGSGGTPKSTNESYFGGDILWVSIADMTANGKYIYSTLKNLSKEGLENSSAKIYPKDTILYAMYASIGECSIAGVPMTSSQAILGIIPNKEKLNSLFLYFHLCSIKEIIKLQGQQGTQSNLNAGIVKDFKLKLPDIKEQQAIADILTTTDKEITELENKLSIIKDQKKYLLNNLITGVIRTPENMKIQT